MRCLDVQPLGFSVEIVACSLMVIIHKFYITKIRNITHYTSQIDSKGVLGFYAAIQDMISKAMINRKQLI